MFQGTDDGHEFLVVDLVVALCRAVLGRQEGHGVEDAIFTVLGQDSSRYVVGGVGLNDDIAVEVEVGEDACRGEPPFELLEGELLILIPMDALVLPGKLGEWLDGG